jgi:hypothetical protein
MSNPNEQKWIRNTRYFMIGSVLAVVLYDIVAVLLGGVEATISRQVYYASVSWPILPVAVGVLIGHLFWPQKIPEIIFVEKDDNEITEDSKADITVISNVSNVELEQLIHKPSGGTKLKVKRNVPANVQARRKKRRADGK